MKSRIARSRAWLVRALTENIGFKIISLTVALFVWAWVQSGQQIERRTRARVEWTLPEGLLSVESLPSSVVVTLGGPQGRVRAIERNQLTFEIDLGEALEGPLAVDFTERNLRGLPQGLSVVQISPLAVDLTLDTPLTRTVKVKPLVMGEPADGFRRAMVSVVPEEVEIVGPQSLVKGIAEIPTDIVDISGATESRVASVPLSLKDRTISTTGERSVEVRIEVEAELSTRVFEDVPVMVRGLGWRSRTEVAEVTLSGPVLDMSSLRPEDVSVIVRAPAPTEGGGSATVVVDYEYGEDDNPVQITFPGQGAVEARSLSPARFVLERTGE